MPQLSRAQLIELSRVPQTIFFTWYENPHSMHYHMMITPDRQCVALFPEWNLHASYTLSSEEIVRRFVFSDTWVHLTREQFCAVMDGRDLPRKPDPRLKTNHKLGAPKGNLP